MALVKSQQPLQDVKKGVGLLESGEQYAGQHSPQTEE